MCSETTSEALPTTDNPLTGVLTPDVPSIPKVSLALGAVELMNARHAKLTTKLGAAYAHDENATLHITAEAPYISSSSAATPVTGKAAPGQGTGTVAVLGPMGALGIDVTPPGPSGAGEGIDFSDVWKFALTFLPLVALASEGDGEPKPLATFDVAVTGTTASIISHELAPGFTGASGLGIDIGCIVSAGGGTILTTIIRCLPSLASGLEAFKSALLSALGPAGVDLVTQLMKCF